MKGPAVMARQSSAPAEQRTVLQALSRSLYPYGLAIGIVAAAAALRLVLLPGLGTRAPFLIFYPAVMVAGLLGGLRAGLLATAFSALLADFFWINPTGSFWIENPYDWLSLAIFILSCVMICAMTGAMSRARARAMYAEDLAQRTAEEQRLQAQEQLVSNRLAAIVESSDDAIIGKDLNSIITSWNKGAEKIFGYTTGEMVGASIMQLLPADRQDEEKQILGKIKRGESVEHFETQRRTKNGRLIDVSITASPIRDAAGKIIGASKVARDITERKRAEEEARKNWQLLRSVIDNTPAKVYVLDQQERFIIVNKAVAELLGTTPERLVGKTRQGLMPEETAARDEANDQLVLASGSPMEFEESGTYQEHRPRSSP